MTHFGEELRKERESRGVALRQIVDITKVSIRYLTSLEQEHFDLLPGGVLNKGIVRSYARAVGIDEKIWVDRFMEAYRESGQMKDDDIHWVEFAENVSKTRDRKPENPFFRLRWAGVLMLVTVIAVSGWLVWNFVNSKVSAASPASQTSHPVAAQMSQSASNGS